MSGFVRCMLSVGQNEDGCLVSLQRPRCIHGTWERMAVLSGNRGWRFGERKIREDHDTKAFLLGSAGKAFLGP